MCAHLLLFARLFLKTFFLCVNAAFWTAQAAAPSNKNVLASSDSVLLQVIKDSVFLGQLQVVQNPQMEGLQLSKTHKQAFSQNVLETYFNGIHL